MATGKVAKSKATKTTSAKPAETVRDGASKTVKTTPGAAAAKFAAAKTGRIIKSSPVSPRLGEERIQTAVESVVHKSQ